MKILSDTILTPIFIQQGTFNNKETNQSIVYYTCLCVFGEQCDKVSIKPDVVPKVELNKKTRFIIEIDTNNNSKPKIVDVAGFVKEKDS